MGWESIDGMETWRSPEEIIRERFVVEDLVRVSTREVLGWFGRERRGSVVNSWINRVLENEGLAISPAIEEADYYGAVEISKLQRQIEPDRDIESETFDESNEEDQSPSVSAESSQWGWILSSLKDDADPFYFVEYGATVGDALETMKEHGCTKLPVFLRGVERTSLIGTVVAADLTCDVATQDDKVVPKAVHQVPVASTTDKLFDCIPLILQHGYIYGRANNGEVVQIYTRHDVAMHLNSLTQMFLRVNEIEDLMRRVLRQVPEEELNENPYRRKTLRQIPLDSAEPPSTLDSDEVSGGGQDVEHVSSSYTFADYMKALSSDDIWERYFSPNLPDSFGKELCIRSLNDARIARNRVMHGSRQEALQSLVPSFECAAVWLRRISPSESSSQTTSPPEDVSGGGEID